MQEIKNVYVDVYCIRGGMVHIFFCLGVGDAQKNNSLCVCTQNFCGVLRWSGNVLTTLGFPSIMFPGELGGNIGDSPETSN